ncbi:PucR family transcriptional regulator [Psychromicrobium xiongbiense]|uniref:PucR family transcriptional regulator n=1 Tax=Psychromicrobium xiongbiense TaxID=3051184 RepID=UPI0025539F0B|nr:helix-turn-helix domain-containing protein [Psychromicrobium sp. YIM S02556]
MKLAELMAREDFGLSAVVLVPEAVGRTLAEPYITDLPDPRPFLSEGDLVLTSGMWLTHPGGTERFVSAAAERRVVAVVIGLLAIGSLPEALIEACRAHQVTLLTVPSHVSFKSIAEAVHGEAQSEALLERSIAVNRRLRHQMGRDDAAQTALDLLGEEFGIDAYTVDGAAQLTARHGQDLDLPFIATLWARMLSSRTRETVTLSDTSGRTLSVWPLELAGGQFGGFVAAHGDHRQWRSEVLMVVDVVIGALRFDAELAARRRQLRNGHVVELVEALSADSISPGDLSAHLRLEGANPLEPFTVVVARADEDTVPLQALQALVRGLFPHHVDRMVDCSTEDSAVLLVNGETGPEGISVDPEGRETLMIWCAGRRVRIGVSDPVPRASGLAGAVRQARHRQETATGTSELVIALTDALVDSHRGLLEATSRQARRQFSQTLLSPVLEYDRRHGSALLETLEVFLDSCGVWQRAAETLFLHPNTLRYRMARVEELTHRDMASMGDRVDLYLALNCLRDTAEEPS